MSGNPKIPKMTEVVWGLNWDDHFPLQLGNYRVEISTLETFKKLKWEDQSFLITSDNSADNFIKDIESLSKDNFLKSMTDFFVFMFHDEIVGIVACELRDWCTYYLRFITIKKEHRSSNLSVDFYLAIEAILRKFPVDKITCDIAPSHMKQVSRMSQLGYVCTGNILSERFGANVQLTKFIRCEAWDVFNKSFTQLFYTKKESEGTTSSPHQLKEYV